MNHYKKLASNVIIYNSRLAFYGGKFIKLDVSYLFDSTNVVSEFLYIISSSTDITLFKNKYTCNKHYEISFLSKSDFDNLEKKYYESILWCPEKHRYPYTYIDFENIIQKVNNYINIL